MLSHINIESILFLDIETVPLAASFDNLPENYRLLWTKKAEFLRKENETAKDVYKRAGIYAEFGKIICISAGYFFKNDSDRQFKITSFSGDNEKEILENFSRFLNSNSRKKEVLLCAHNGKEFDFPFIARRMLINELKLPSLLNIFGKKPWEVAHLDTMDLWKFGDYKNFTSLELLASVFNIPTPKDDINGGDIWRVYWEEKNLNRIIAYCQKDVITIARIFLKYRGESSIEDRNVLVV